MAMSTPLHRLADHGQSVWIDFLSRELLRGGELARMMREDAVSGVTSNPTIFQKAISAGDAYDDQLRDLIETENDPKEIFIQLAATDVRDASDLLRSVWDEGCRGCDGYVSIEVDPNLYVKIPATKAGLPAIEEMIAKGKSINVTLIFSLARYAEVAEAYIRGLERLVAAGGDAGSVASVASFFVSRVDTEADRRLDELGAHDELKGKLAIANAKLAYQRYQETFAGERWKALAARGAWRQRCLWASTSTKNPAYSDVMYVEELIGAETVNTMPDETIRAFQDHGTVAPTLDRGLDEAQRVFEH